MKYMISAIICAAIFSSATYPMDQLQGTIGAINTAFPGLLQTAAIGAASGGVIPAVVGVFSIAGGGQQKSNFAQATALGIGFGGRLGTIFYVVSSPLSTGRISGFIAPKVANLFTVICGLGVGLLTTLQSNRR